jgi:hypothetical protein
MTDNTTDPTNNTAPPLGLVSRMVGVITSPRATFERIVATPRVLGAMLAIGVLSGVVQGAFLTTARGQQAWLDTVIESAEKRGSPLPPEGIDRMQKIAQFVGPVTVVGSIAVTPIFMAAVAGIFFAIFTFGTGGTASYKQVLAVIAHAASVSVLGLIFAVIIQFARGTISVTGGANLGILLPMLPDNSFISKLLGFIDLFRVWWCFTLAIGLGVLYRRRTAPIAMTFLVLMVAIAAGAAAIF